MSSALLLDETLEELVAVSGSLTGPDYDSSPSSISFLPGYAPVSAKDLYCMEARLPTLELPGEEFEQRRFVVRAHLGEDVFPNFSCLS